MPNVRQHMTNSLNITGLSGNIKNIYAPSAEERSKFGWDENQFTNKQLFVSYDSSKATKAPNLKREGGGDKEIL